MKYILILSLLSTALYSMTEEEQLYILINNKNVPNARLKFNNGNNEYTDKNSCLLTLNATSKIYLDKKSPDPWQKEKPLYQRAKLVIDGCHEEIIFTIDHKHPLKPYDTITIEIVNQQKQARKVPTVYVTNYNEQLNTAPSFFKKLKWRPNGLKFGKIILPQDLIPMNTLENCITFRNRDVTNLLLCYQAYNLEKEKFSITHVNEVIPENHTHNLLLFDNTPIINNVIFLHIQNIFACGFYVDNQTICIGDVITLFYHPNKKKVIIINQWNKKLGSFYPTTTTTVG